MSVSWLEGGQAGGGGKTWVVKAPVIRWKMGPLFHIVGSGDAAGLEQCAWIEGCLPGKQT